MVMSFEGEMRRGDRCAGRDEVGLEEKMAWNVYCGFLMAWAVLVMSYLPPQQFPRLVQMFSTRIFQLILLLPIAVVSHPHREARPIPRRQGWGHSACIRPATIGLLKGAGKGSVARDPDRGTGKIFQSGGRAEDQGGWGGGRAGCVVVVVISVGRKEVVVRREREGVDLDIPKCSIMNSQLGWTVCSVKRRG